MRQTLFYFPETLGGVPLFGFGWALAALLVIGGFAMYRRAIASTWTQAFTSLGPALALAAIVIAFIFPAIERMAPVTREDLLPGNGVPIRGYGFMLILAAVSSVWLAARRAEVRGIPGQRIYDLAFSFFLCGILGARLMFVLHNLDSFRGDSWMTFLANFVNIAQGGLVVYGSLLGAAVAFFAFASWHRLPVLKLGDAIAPCLLVGLAFGRMGCFLNGCCWGGVTDRPWGVTFPEGSPPYQAQLERGQYFGFSLELGDDDAVRVAAVRPGSVAAEGGLPEGLAIDRLNDIDLTGVAGTARERIERAWQGLAAAKGTIRIAGHDGSRYELHLREFPTRSLPIHPTQLYDTLNSLVLLAFVLACEPFLPRPGMVAAMCFTLYPISRFLLEVIRDDEVGFAGTSWTISQWMSVLIFVAAVGLWCWLLAPWSGPRRVPAVKELSPSSNV